MPSSLTRSRNMMPPDAKARHPHCQGPPHALSPLPPLSTLPSQRMNTEDNPRTTDKTPKGTKKNLQTTRRLSPPLPVKTPRKVGPSTLAITIPTSKRPKHLPRRRSVGRREARDEVCLDLLGW